MAVSTNYSSQQQAGTQSSSGSGTSAQNTGYNGTSSMLSNTGSTSSALVPGAKPWYEQSAADQAAGYGALRSDVAGQYENVLAHTTNQEQGLLNQAMGETANFGKTQQEQLNNQFAQAKGQQDQDLTNRGLGNTTVRSAVSQGLTQAQGLANTNLAQQVSQQKVGVLNQFGQPISRSIEALGGAETAATAGIAGQGLAARQGLQQQYGNMLERQTNSQQNTAQSGANQGSSNTAQNYANQASGAFSSSGSSRGQGTSPDQQPGIRTGPYGPMPGLSRGGGQGGRMGGGGGGGRAGGRGGSPGGPGGNPGGSPGGPGGSPGGPGGNPGSSPGGNPGNSPGGSPGGPGGSPGNGSYNPSYDNPGGDYPNDQYDDEYGGSGDYPNSYNEPPGFYDPGYNTPGQDAPGPGNEVDPSTGQPYPLPQTADAGGGTNNQLTIGDKNYAWVPGENGQAGYFSGG